MTGGAIGSRGRLSELQVALERLLDRDRDRSARRRRSPGGRGSPGTRSRRPARSSRASPGRRSRVFGTRSHSISRTYATRRRDDQPVGLEHSETGSSSASDPVMQRLRRARARALASGAGAASRTSPSLSGRSAARAAWLPAVAVERQQVAARSDRLALQRQRDARDERDHEHDDGHGRAEPERGDPDRAVEDRRRRLRARPTRATSARSSARDRSAAAASASSLPPPGPVAGSRGGGVNLRAAASLGDAAGRGGSLLSGARLAHRAASRRRSVTLRDGSRWSSRLRSQSALRARGRRAEAAPLRSPTVPWCPV